MLRRLRRVLSMTAVAAVAGGGLVLAPAAAASAAGCTPKTGPYQRQVEAYLHLPVDGVASQADCVAVLTAHRQFLVEPLWEHAKLIVDTRNVVPAAANVRRF